MREPPRNHQRAVKTWNTLSPYRGNQRKRGRGGVIQYRIHPLTVMRMDKQDGQLSGKSSNIQIYTIHLKAPHRQRKKRFQNRYCLVFQGIFVVCVRLSFIVFTRNYTFNNFKCARSPSVLIAAPLSIHAQPGARMRDDPERAGTKRV